MALMRGNPYIYRTDITHEGELTAGWWIHTPDGEVALPHSTMEELAVMVLAGMSEEQKLDAIRRCIDLHEGNFGADPLMAAVGLPTVMERIAKVIEFRRTVEEESREG